MITTLTIKGRPPVLGTFSKGTPGSVSINFNESAGPDCDDGCRWKDNGCYAQTVEARPDRQPLAAKLARHGNTRPDWILSRGLAELEARAEPPPWVRLCTNGSLPANPTPAMAKQIRRLGDYAAENDMLDHLHIPAESARKAAAYRAMDRRLVVRESAQTWHRWINARGPMSTVASGPGISFLDRITEARRVAQARRDATGRPGGVSPAVTQTFRQKIWMAGRIGAARRGVEWTAPKPPSMKCGPPGVGCNLCARRNYDVTYPFHA